MTNDENRVIRTTCSASESFSHRSFRLPVGLSDLGGRESPSRCHRDGTLRAATATDEMRVLQDFRVHLRPETFLPLMLARTILRLGDREHLDVRHVESLCASDLEMLEEVYRELNGYPPASRSRTSTETP